MASGEFDMTQSRPRTPQLLASRSLSGCNQTYSERKKGESKENSRMRNGQQLNATSINDVISIPRSKTTSVSVKPELGMHR